MASYRLNYIFILTLFLCFDKYSFGQKSNHIYDSILIKALERNIEHPYYRNKGMTGANIIKISKKDSTLSFTSIFKTDTKFEILDYERVIKDVNKRCNKFVDKPFELFIPIYFLFVDMDDVPFDPKDKIKVDKKLNKLRRQKKNICSLDVTIIESIPVR